MHPIKLPRPGHATSASHLPPPDVAAHLERLQKVIRKRNIRVHAVPRGLAAKGASSFHRALPRHAPPDRPAR